MLHVPFPQHKACIIATECKSIYSKQIFIGEHRLQVTYLNENGTIPSGIYPRRLISFLTKFITQKRSKHPTVTIPNNRSNFIKEVLSVNYVPSRIDYATIINQLRAFTECLLSLSFTNSNESSRKNRSDFNFFSGDHSWLWDDSKPWQDSITLSDDFFELIKSSAVPISEYAVTNYKNALKLDLFNYFTYQNYNLYLKKLNHQFYYSDLHYMFGSGTSSIHEFRKVFNKLVLEFKYTTNLQFTEYARESLCLISNEDALLKKHKRRKTNVDAVPEVNIKEDTKEKLNQQYGEIEVMAAMSYLRNKAVKNSIRHPHAYLKDVLKNPSWYRKERVKTIELIHKTQFAQFKELKDSDKRLLKSELVHRIQKTPIGAVEHNSENYLLQLKNPGHVIVKIPNFEYCLYLYWVLLSGLLTETNNVYGENQVINLYKQLLH